MPLEDRKNLFRASRITAHESIDVHAVIHTHGPRTNTPRQCLTLAFIKYDDSSRIVDDPPGPQNGPEWSAQIDRPRVRLLHISFERLRIRQNGSVSSDDICTP